MTITIGAVLLALKRTHQVIKIDANHICFSNLKQHKSVARVFVCRCACCACRPGLTTGSRVWACNFPEKHPRSKEKCESINIERGQDDFASFLRNTRITPVK